MTIVKKLMLFFLQNFGKKSVAFEMNDKMNFEEFVLSLISINIYSNMSPNVLMPAYEMSVNLIRIQRTDREL
jgi:hypothetical protein